MSLTDQPTATIFDIQRCALHDGPGIRTNIFFKGCPLTCSWCHNPESQNIAPNLSYNGRLCRGCRMCESVCEQDVHEFSEDENGSLIHIVHHDRCTACGKCVAVCCYDALELVGKQYTVDELVQELQSDLPYYEIGEGGGITLTGGDPMLQVSFIEAFLNKLEGVHVCMETAGYASKSAILRILPLVDLFLYDYKVTDAQLHKQYCGETNHIILENLALLHDRGAKIVLRLPIIPSVNDTEEHFRGIAETMKKFPNILKAEIMPYHTLGEGKCEQYGLHGVGQAFRTPARDEVQGWLDRIRELGVSNIEVS